MAPEEICIVRWLPEFILCLPIWIRIHILPACRRRLKLYPKNVYDSKKSPHDCLPDLFVNKEQDLK